jgi:two-component system response regulator LytT
VGNTIEEALSMVKTILCDDDPRVLDYYQALLQDAAKENGIDIKINRYESGEQLLFMLSDNPNVADIIYLDILMGKMNGIETARKLREIGCLSQIIYLTTSDEYVFEAFDVEPYYYIVKDDMSAWKFKDIFCRAVETVQRKENDFIVVSYGATTVKLQLDNILFFEVRNRLITVHTRDSDIDYYSRLEDVEHALRDKGFARIHRSYLVNCHHIQRLTRSSIILSNGTELPVSAKYSPAVQEQFSRYLLQI